MDIDEPEPELEVQQDEAVEVSDDDDEGLVVDKENKRYVMVTEKPNKQRKKVFSSYKDDLMLTAISEANKEIIDHDRGSTWKFLYRS